MSTELSALRAGSQRSGNSWQRPTLHIAFNAADDYTPVRYCKSAFRPRLSAKFSGIFIFALIGGSESLKNLALRAGKPKLQDETGWS